MGTRANIVKIRVLRVRMFLLWVVGVYLLK